VHHLALEEGDEEVIREGRSLHRPTTKSSHPNNRKHWHSRTGHDPRSPWPPPLSGVTLTAPQSASFSRAARELLSLRLLPPRHRGDLTRLCSVPRPRPRLRTTRPRYRRRSSRTTPLSRRSLTSRT
jgi:hypothetical protein